MKGEFLYVTHFKSIDANANTFCVIERTDCDKIFSWPSAGPMYSPSPKLKVKQIQTKGSNNQTKVQYMTFKIAPFGAAKNR